MSDPCHSLLLDFLNRQGENTLWLVDENVPGNFVFNIAPNPLLYAVTNRFDIQQSLRNRQIQAELSDFRCDQPTDSFDRVVYRVSKERAQVHHCINKAAQLLKPGGRLILIGQKNDGIKTNAKHAEGLFDGKATSKKHGLCYTAELEKAGPLKTELPSDHYPELRQIEQSGLTFYSKPGIFGWDKVDRGSELLVHTLRNHLGDFKTGGRLLDLGCGWGYLILATVDLNFSVRVATDNNVTALLAAERNFLAAGLEVETVADDCGSQLDETFHLILCNPAFHRGFSVSDELSKKFIRQTARLLARGGNALFVVNQFIPLEKLAEGQFRRITLLAQEQGFKVFALGQ